MYEHLKEITYWFVSDYYDYEVEYKLKERLDPKENFARNSIEHANLDDESYLYRYGSDIGENERQTFLFMKSMNSLDLEKMANTFTEGYRIGFIKGNKDITKKKVVNIIYPIGFEKVIKLAMDNFKEMGLDVTLT